MAKIGASATIKQKKDPTPVQQATPQPVAVGKPLVTATVGPVQTYTQPVNNGFAMTPQTTTAVVGPVQQGTSTPEEIQAARALALDNLRQRAQTKAQAAVDYKLNKLNKGIAQENAAKRLQHNEYRKQADYNARKNLQSWMDTFQAYRDEGSWNENTRKALTEAYYPTYSNYKHYGSGDNQEDLLKELKAARTTLTGGQNLKDYFDNGSFTNNRYQNPDYLTAFTARQAQLEGINGNPKASAMLMATNDEMEHWYDLKQQDDKDGTRNADAYLDEMYSTWETRYGQRNVAYEAPKLAEEHPIIATIGAVTANSGPLGLYQLAENLVNAANGKDINPYSWGNAGITSSGIMKETVANNIDNPVARLAYRATTAAAESMAGVTMLGGLGKAGNVATKLSLAATAMTSRTNQELMKGTPQGMALLQGAIDGGIEYATETLGGIDKFLDKIRSGDTRLIINTLKQMVSEGAEEGVGDIFRIGADAIIAGVNALRGDGFNLYSDEIYNYERYGYMSRDEAVKQVILDKIKEIGTDTLIGGVSGGMMGSAATAVNYNRLISLGREATTNADGSLNMEAVQSLVERGQNMPANTLSHRQAALLQQKLNEGKSVTPREAAVLYANNVAAEKAVPGKQMREVYRAETDPAEWQAAKDEAMGHAADLNPNVRTLYETAVEEAIDNGATGRQAIAEFDRAYTSGFNKLQAPQTTYLSEETVKEVMDAGKAERKGTQASGLKTSVKTNAEQILNKVNNYAENGSKVYPAAVSEALDNGATPEQARVAFNEVYSNVYTNKPIPTNTSIPLSAPTIANIREAALKDRFAAENKARADAIPVNTNAGVAISDPVIRQHVEQGRLTETVDFADEMGKLFGEKVSLVAKLPQNGQINLRTGEIVVALNTDFGGIIDRDRAMRATLGHELAHRMRQVSPKTWNKFTQAVIGSDIDQFNADVNRMIKDTYKGDITRDAAQEEVLADYIGNRFFSGDIDTLKNMVESIDSLPQRSGFIQHIVDMASWIKSKLTGQPANNAARIETEFKKMFKETQAKVQQAEAAKVVPLSSEKAALKPGNVNAERNPEAVKALETEGVAVSADGDMFTKESRRTWDATDKKKVKQNLLKMGFTEAEVDKWINDVNSVSAIIAENTDRLDYFAAPNQKFLKANGDYYKKTLDASTLCAKRLLYQGTYDAIMHQLPNTPLLAEDVIRLRELMKDMGHEVPCGICYVESRRKALGKYASEWLAEYDGEYVPTLDQVVTSDGLEALRTEHPQTYNDFVKAMKAKGTASPKVVELRTEYREDLKSLPQTSVDYLNSIGGLRINSFSDFETPHLIDFMQAVMDMSSKGLKGMAYTKVPAFAWVFGDTGIKINLSLIVKTDANGNVVRDDNGRIMFDEREGINPEEAQRLREAYPNNVGTIAVAKDMENTLELLNDDRVDFVIPFHRSGWSKAEYMQLGLKGYSDFATGHQETGIYPSQYWDYKKAGKENAEEYLRRCAEAGITPVFEQLLDENADGSYSLKTDGSTDNYWKLLVEGRMYNNEGVGVQQQAVKPNFNMERAMDVLNSYDGDPNKLPVAHDVVDAYVKEYKEAHSDQVKFSRRSSTAMDSNGRTLTPEQAEFFADSKARDADGNLLVLYHGTDGAGFNTFRGTVWMTTSRRDAGSYGVATRTYDPNEQRVDVPITGGNFTIGKHMRFDTEQDRTDFLKEYPEAANYLSPREMIAAKGAAEMEDDYDRYDELVAQEKADKKIWRAYRQYEDQHSEIIPLQELIDNKDLYTIDDFKDAFLSIDKEAYFDNEYDDYETDEEFKDVIANDLEQSFITEQDGWYSDFPVRVRIPEGKTSTAADITRIHNRIYEMYANVTRPYVYDAKGRSSEGNGTYYAAVQTAMDSDEYDGAIINNIRTGRYQELGTVVVTKDPSQVKLVSNQNPTRNPDIRYSKRASDAEYMAAVKANDTESLKRMVTQAAKEAGYTTEAFHGTNAKFNQFKAGSHFGSTVYQALDRLGFYNDILDEYEDDPEVQELLNRAKETGANVLNLYIKADNPVRVSDFGSWDMDVLAERMPEYLPDIDWANINTVKGAFDEMIANGYDSIVYENIHEGRDEDEGENDAYILFDPRQAKLADLITYDNSGNVIPLSERFNTENPDIRYSKRASSSKDAVIRRQQETIDRLRHEMVETHGVEPDPKAIADAAVQFGRDWQSTMPETEIKDAFADIAKEFATYRRLSNQGADPALIRSVENRFTDKCTELANKVVKSAAVLVGDNARAQELKQFVWNHPIQIDPSFKKEFGEYPALREAVKGRIKLAKDGMPISRLYESLNEQFSDYPLFQEFEGETLEPVDMLLDLLDLINDFDKAYNPYDTADAVDTVAAEIMNTIFDAPVSKPTFADRKAAEVNAAKTEAAQAREQARKQTPADIKAYYEGKLNDIKEQRDRYLADLVQAYKDRSARAKESEERARLLRIMKRVDRLAKKSSDARRAEIKEITGDFDLVAQRLSNHKVQELTELADWVRRNKDNPDAIITPQISDKLARLDKQHISDLTIGDVRAITEALQEIEHRIRTENRIIGLNERRNTVDIGKQIIQDVRNAPGTGSSALARGMDKFLINGLMRPETEFLRLVGFNKNSPLYEYTFGDRLSLLTGQKTMQDYQREANERYFRQFLDDKEFMKSITGKNARTIEITGTDEQGKQHTVKVTPDFIMAMYMHSQNVQNLMHIVNYTDEFGREVKAGGMTVPDYKLYKDGKKTEAYNAGTKLTFTRSQFNDQLKGLTPKEMEFIRAAQRYYSEMSQPRINDVSEKLLGYSLAKVDNYFRINTDPDYRGGDMENLRFDGTIEGMGWTKERVNGKNPILLIPLSEQLQKDIVAHSKYVGMAIPIRNFSKIYGVNENTYSQNADGKWELQNAYASSVIKEINKKHPSGADTNYIRDLLADIQNPASNMSALDKVFAALRSKYAGSVLTLNLGVALKQAASFSTAAAEIGWGPILKTVPQFVKAMGGFAKPMNQKTIDFISKYSPLMRLRTEGMSTQELADMQRLNHKIPGVLNWIQNVDVGTVAALWKASEEYVKQNFKDLKPGTEEFYQKVGDVHTRVITKTQPNYSELQRPGLLRSKSEITKTLMMFKTQPFQNFNILYEAVGSFKAAERAYKANPTEETKAARNESRKRLAWAVSSQVVSNSVFAAMQVIWDIMRRKEDPLDDEDKNVQRLNNFFKNMISSWAGMIPGGSQALEVVEKWVDDALVAMGGEKYFDSKVYGFELDASIEGLNKMVDLITNIPNLGGDIFGLIKGDENKEEYLRDLFKQFKDVSAFFGIPTNNVMNLTKATMEWAMTKGLGYSDEEARYLTDRYLNGVNNSTYSKKHYAELALAAGEETMQRFRDDKAFDTDSKSAAEYLQEMQTKAEKDKFAEEYGTKEIYVADRDSVTEEAFREFAEKYAQTNDGNGSKSAHDILTALAATDLSEDEKEAIYDLYDYKTPYEKAAGKVEAEAAAEEPVASTAEPVASTMEAPTRAPLGQARPQGTLTNEVSVGNSQAPTPISKTSTRIRYSKDEMLNVYGANEMYLDTNPLKGDRLDEFNRAYAAVTDNNDSVSQKELAAALNAMGVSLEEGEQIWAAYSQAHADKWGDGWKKTYASYYSGGSSGGSSGGGTSKSSGGGGGRSSGSSRSSSASTQPVVGPYPGYSSTPAIAAPTYTQPVAMPEPVATAPQTPYTGLQRHSEGGNVDLTFRPVLRAVELRRKGWGGVLSDTVRNFVKSYFKDGKALNFTPIVLDKDGNYVRTLSPNELREYAEAVLKGEREDDLKLQVGTAYEGADAMAQAEKAAAEIAQLDKDYTQTA